MSDDMKPTTDQTRFEQLLPFYITHNLSDEDRGFMQTYIATHPDAKKAAHFAERLSRIVRNTGTNRNPEAALNRLLADYQPRHRMSLIQRLKAKLRSLGISPPLAIALLVIVGQGIGYTAHKMNWFGTDKESVVSPAEADLSITLKRGAEMGAVVTILEKYGASIVHSTAAGDVQKIFVSIIDKARLQPLIDAIMELGIVDSVAVLL
ncbi:MAG: hypothetical protein RL651_798 [Pseudomonadota bacterium]|jgi:hypothetical protein